MRLNIYVDIGDILNKNLKMMNNLGTVAPKLLKKQANECAKFVKEHLKLTMKKDSVGKASEGRLEKSIEVEKINETTYGIGNYAKMPRYWSIQEHGGYVPPRGAKSKKVMHFLGYGGEFFRAWVKGFILPARHFFVNGFAIGSFRAVEAFRSAMNFIVRG